MNRNWGDREVPETVQDLIDRGALFVVNHSGGKDSQAMLIFLRRVVPARQLLVIHASLGQVEWPGTIEHIESTIGDLPLMVCAARKHDGSARTFLNMVDDKAARLPDVSPWPSPKNRQCTSDLKRTPIEREVRRYLKVHPEFGGLVVQCVGIRAGESENRAKATPFKQNKAQSKAGRQWFEWLPIFRMTTLEVFASIAAAGQQVHWCYQAGMTRMSCCLCIMASQADLALGAELRPDLLVAYAVREAASGFTFRMDRRPLTELATSPKAPLPPLAELAQDWRAAA